VIIPKGNWIVYIKLVSIDKESLATVSVGRAFNSTCYESSTRFKLPTSVGVKWSHPISRQPTIGEGSEIVGNRDSASQLLSHASPLSQRLLVLFSG
jgi:hypothetical protein